MYSRCSVDASKSWNNVFIFIIMRGGATLLELRRTAPRSLLPVPALPCRLSSAAVFPIIDIVHPEHPYAPLRTDTQVVALLVKRKRNGPRQEWDDSIGGLDAVADYLEPVAGGFCTKVVFERKRAKEILLPSVFGLRQCLLYAELIRDAGDGRM